MDSERDYSYSSHLHLHFDNLIAPQSSFIFTVVRLRGLAGLLCKKCGQVLFVPPELQPFLSLKTMGRIYSQRLNILVPIPTPTLPLQIDSAVWLLHGFLGTAKSIPHICHLHHQRCRCQIFSLVSKT